MAADHLEETDAHRGDRLRNLAADQGDPAPRRHPMVPLSECCAWCRDRLTPKG